MLDAEQLEVDKQLSILERRLRETSEDDTLVYDALLQQFLTLVNRKQALETCIHVAVEGVVMEADNSILNHRHFTVFLLYCR